MARGLMFTLNGGSSSGGGSGSGVSSYANAAALPALAADAAVAITADTYTLWSFDLATTTWQPEASPGTVFSIATFDSGTGSAKGASLGAAGTNSIIMQSATATVPGLVNTGSQTFAGAKTFNSTINGSISGNAATATASTTATTATNATNVATTAVSNNASYFVLAVASSSNGNQAASLSTGISYNPSTNALTATTFVGALTGNASTATSATTATTATNATNVATTAVSNNAAYFILAVAASANGNQAASLSTGISYNPSTNALTATTFLGALNGNATTATSATSCTTATNATNISTTATNSTNATFFPTFVTQSATSNQAALTATGLTFNPSTNTLTTTTFVGALTGNASTATKATNIAGGLGGSIPYQSAADTTVLLANGTANQVLYSAGGTAAPAWAAEKGLLVVVADAAISGNYTPANTRRQVCKVHGNGGAVVLTDILATNAVSGDELVLHGQDSTNTVQVGGTATVTTNGTAILAQNCIISFYYDGATWQETSRNF